MSRHESTPTSDEEIVTLKDLEAEFSDDDPSRPLEDEFSRLDQPQESSEETIDTSAPESPSEIVDAAVSRVDRARDEGDRLFESGKKILGKNGRAVAKIALASGKIVLGFTSLGMQKAWQSTRTRTHQYRLNRAHGKATKEYAAYKKTTQDTAYESYQENITVARDNELADIARNELNRLDSVATGDANDFNAKPEGIADDHDAILDAAKQDRVNMAHSEALEMNEQYDSEKAAHEARVEQELRAEEARIAKEQAEYSETYDKVEDFLKQLKGRKDMGFTEVRQALRSEFGKEMAGDQHISDAVEDAFDVFAGKKMKKAARAERIAQSRAKAKELRTKAYESTRDAVRDSETYQRASSRTRKIGRAVVRFASRSLGAARAAKAAWQESAPKPTTESEPTDNE